MEKHMRAAVIALVVGGLGLFGGSTVADGRPDGDRSRLQGPVAGSTSAGMKTGSWVRLSTRLA